MATDLICAMCTFCEQDGPRVYFTTQAFRDDSDLLQNDCPCPSNSSVQCSDDETAVFGPPRNDSRGRRDFYGKLDVFEVDPLMYGDDIVKTCDGCMSAENFKPLIYTNDDAGHTTFVSSQYPYDHAVFAMLHRACTRALSVEHTSDENNATFFGMNTDGYALSLDFKVLDPMARGSTHRYAVVLLSPYGDEPLISRYTFLTKSLKTFVTELQAQVQTYQDNALKEYDQLYASLHTTNKFRLKDRDSFSGRLKTSAACRSLAELTGEEDILRKVHRFFTSILMYGGNEKIELLLEGAPTQDTLVRIELMRDRSRDEILDADCSFDDDDQLDQVSYRCATAIELTADRLLDLCTLYRILGSVSFHTIAYHTVMGNQLVVKTNEPILSSRILHAFSCMIPLGCCKLIEFCDEYHEAFKANLLGLRSDCDISTVVKRLRAQRISEAARLETTSMSRSGSGCVQSAMVVINATLPRMSSHERREARFSSSDLPIGQSVSLVLENAMLVVDFEGAYPAPPLGDSPIVLRVMEELVCTGQELGLGFLVQRFFSLREEWMIKVKRRFEFSRQQALNDGKSDAKFRMLLSLLKCSEVDIPLLKFWSDGLSNAYKSYVFQVCAKEQLKLQTNDQASHDPISLLNENLSLKLNLC